MASVLAQKFNEDRMARGLPGFSLALLIGRSRLAAGLVVQEANSGRLEIVELARARRPSKRGDRARGEEQSDW